MLKHPEPTYKRRYKTILIRRLDASGPWSRYLFAVVISIVCAIIRYALQDLLAYSAPFILFYPAVVLAALYGGLSSGLTATFVSAVLSTYWLRPLGRVLVIERTADWFALGVFIITCSTVSFIIETMQRARHRAARAEAQVSIAKEREERDFTIQQNEARLKTILNNVPAPIFLKDAHGRYLFINRAWLDVMGVEEKDVIGRTAYDLFPKTVADAMTAEDENVISRQHALDVEQAIPLRDGIHTILTRKIGLRDATSAAYSTCGISTDITERNRVEHELRESRNFLTILTDNLPGMVGYWDKNLRCRFANKAYIEWFGRKPEDILGITIQELMGEELFRKNEPYIREALRGKRQQYERALVKPSGEVGHVLADYIPDLDEEGGFKGFYVLVTDVTRVKQAEIREREMNERLRAERDRADKANRAKSEFLANMSHEIRTPMNGVLGMTQLALTTSTEPEVCSYLKLVEESGRSLLSIINDILDLSKIEAGKVELEQKPFLLRPLVESTIRPLAITAEGKNLTLRLSVDVEAPDKLIGDAGRLRQVLTNLIGNAVKFTTAGMVAVTVTPASEPASSSDHARLLFCVRDTGIGIPQDRLEHVFESFAQMNNSAHIRYGGTGLGLTISKELVEMMGGSIRVESEVGKGSLFSFTAEFDLAKMALEESANEVRAVHQLQPLKILLVEDNIVNQILATELLKREGHAVTTVSDGKEALEELKRQSFDIVLMDARMPEMDGEEATRRIREGETLDPQVPIIALTAYALAGDRERFIAAGMDDYLSKPINREDLNQALTRVMAKRNKGGMRQ